jgi:hypothetical protein
MELTFDDVMQIRLHGDAGAVFVPRLQHVVSDQPDEAGHEVLGVGGGGVTGGGGAQWGEGCLFWK